MHKVIQSFNQFINEFEIEGTLNNREYFSLGFVSVPLGEKSDFYRIVLSNLSRKYKNLNILKISDFKEINVRGNSFQLSFKINFTSEKDTFEHIGKCDIQPFEGKIFNMDIE